MGYHQSNSGVKGLKYFFFKKYFLKNISFIGNNDDSDVANDGQVAYCQNFIPSSGIFFFCFYFLVSLKGDISGEKKG